MLSIVTSLETFSLDPSLPGRPQSAAAVRGIRHAVAAMQGQFRDLLTIAGSDAGPPSIPVDTFEFGELVHDVCAGLEDAAAAKRLALRVNFAVPIAISADPVRIAQVLRNLVENAVRTAHRDPLDSGSTKHRCSGVESK